MFQAGCCHTDDTWFLAVAEPAAAAVYPPALPWPGLRLPFFLPNKVCDLVLFDATALSNRIHLLSVFIATFVL